MNSTTPTAMNFANHYGYSDVNPYEIVRRVSDRTIEVRRMDATIDPSWKRVFIPGGFCGHTANNGSQKWVIVSNPQNQVIRIRLTKKGWNHKGMRFQLADKPVHFYDFNF
jgi:hypothetical protein